MGRHAVRVRRLAAGGNADSLVNELGLTGIQFVNVSNGCATGGSALLSAYSAIKAGSTTWAWRSASTSIRAARSNADPKSSGLETWYGETGLMLTTQFFGMKIQKYLHDYDLSPECSASSRRRASATAS